MEVLIALLIVDACALIIFVCACLWAPIDE